MREALDNWGAVGPKTNKYTKFTSKTSQQCDKGCSAYEKTTWRE
jgi:hypothetical protein